jgi:Hypothetical methyltransferase
VPLGAESVDVVVFSLSLMGVNCGEFVREAFRVLKSRCVSPFDLCDSSRCLSVSVSFASVSFAAVSVVTLSLSLSLSLAGRLAGRLTDCLQLYVFSNRNTACNLSLHFLTPLCVCVCVCVCVCLFFRSTLPQRNADRGRGALSYR